MDPISDTCRLCLDSFAERFTTIENPQLKVQMEKVFCFPVEPKEGHCSGVCQNCSYAISEFYQYSENVRQNQEILNGKERNCDPTVDSKITLESVKFETLSDSGLPETTKDTSEPKDEVSGEEDTPIADLQISVETFEVETLSDVGLTETTEGACEPKYEVSGEEEVPKSGDDESNGYVEVDELTKTSKQQKRNDEDQLFNKHFRMICDLCGTSAATFTELRSHFKTEHKGRDGYVVCCNKKLFNRYCLRNHIDFHANPDVFRCEVCGKKYKDKSSLNIHKLCKHSSAGLYNCDHCLQSFERKHALAQHMKRHVENKCPECSNMFSCKRSLSRHMAIQHSGENRTMVCDTCGKEFRDKQCFDQHMKEHMAIKVQRIQCGICQRWLKNKKSLQYHMNWKHTEADREVQCDICLQKYRHSRALYKHKLTHAEPKHECEFCGKMFQKANALKVHRATHTGEVLRVQCGICQHWLNSKQSLQRHMKWVHTDDELECDICLQKYPHSRALYNHKHQTHAEAKFNCKLCGKTFKKAISLKEHNAIHTGEVLYTCEYCGKPSNCKSKLYQHVKQQHPAEWAQKKLITHKSGLS